MKKKDIKEVLDSDQNLIGSDDIPSNNPNEITAMGTTDHNSAIHGQHFAHDFLGRFGFYMYNEGEDGDDTSSTDELLNDIAQTSYNHFNQDRENFESFENATEEDQMRYKLLAQKIIGLLSNKKEKKVDPTLSESELSKMIEDVITTKTDKSISSKKSDNDILDKKLKEKLKSLFDGLSDKDRGELIQHLKSNQ
jgi:hypothetical protein